MSYDIVCQWSVHIWDHMVTYSHHLHFDWTGCKVIFLVPKFHLPACIKKCQTAFSFNLTSQVGRTDGEAPEYGWVDINHVATSTHKIGPGSHRDTLDDHFSDWNWKKIVTLGRSHFHSTLFSLLTSHKDQGCCWNLRMPSLSGQIKYGHSIKWWLPFHWHQLQFGWLPLNYGSLITLRWIHLLWWWKVSYISHKYNRLVTHIDSSYDPAQCVTSTSQSQCWRYCKQYLPRSPCNHHPLHDDTYTYGPWIPTNTVCCTFHIYSWF